MQLLQIQRPVAPLLNANTNMPLGRSVMKLNELVTAASMPPVIMSLAMLFSLGCENKEKILDVETPRTNVEIERDRDTGKVEVDVNRKDEQLLDSDVPGADVEVQRDKDSGDIEIK